MDGSDLEASPEDSTKKRKYENELEDLSTVTAVGQVAAMVDCSRLLGDRNGDGRRRWL